MVYSTNVGVDGAEKDWCGFNEHLNRFMLHNFGVVGIYCFPSLLKQSQLYI